MIVINRRGNNETLSPPISHKLPDIEKPGKKWVWLLAYSWLFIPLWFLDWMEHHHLETHEKRSLGPHPDFLKQDRHLPTIIESSAWPHVRKDERPQEQSPAFLPAFLHLAACLTLSWNPVVLKSALKASSLLLCPLFNLIRLSLLLGHVCVFNFYFICMCILKACASGVLGAGRGHWILWDWDWSYWSCELPHGC